MANTKNKKSVSRGERIDFKKIVWVIDNLTKDHMKQHDDKPATPQEITEGVFMLAEEGAKVSFKFDTYSGKGYLMTATFDTTGHTNSGYAISARGVDFSDCASILLYKYFTVAERDLSLWDYGKDEGFQRG